MKTGYSTDLNGASREFRNSQGALVIVFALALVFISSDSKILAG